MDEGGAQDRSRRFLLLFALAWAGGAVAYTPLLTILLPMRVAEQAGQAAGVEWLALIALVGAVSASIGSILFGFLSDITRNRRGWILTGLILSSLLLLLVGRASGLQQLVASIFAWQLALNMMLGPLAAWAGDRVPDRQKGMLGGLMAFAPVLGAVAGVVATHPGLPAAVDRIMLVAGLVALCVVPALVLLPSSAPRRTTKTVAVREAGAPGPSNRRPLIVMWLARLAVQIAEATLFTYLFFWLRSLDPDIAGHQAARLFGAVMIGSAPLAILVGRWSDRTNRPILPLALCATAGATGLAAMGLTTDLMWGMLAFGLFGLASGVFLALHSAQTLRILPNPLRRGRDLGLFNLANTAPSLMMPLLAVTLVPLFGFSGLFLCLAVLSLAAAALLFGVARQL